MNAHEIVVHEIDRHHMRMVRGLLCAVRAPLLRSSASDSLPQISGQDLSRLSRHEVGKEMPAGKDAARTFAAAYAIALGCRTVSP